MLIFLNGKYVHMKNAEISNLSPGNISGIGVFETMRVERYKILFFDEHMKRLTRGLKRLNIKNKYRDDDIKHLIRSLVYKNNLKFSKFRITIWVQDGKHNFSVVWHPIKSMPSKVEQIKIAANIANRVRYKTRYSHLKTIDYSCFQRAYLEARNNNFSESILFNSKGEIVEGARMNIFFIKRDILYTPYISCGCLKGIARDIVIKLARAINITIKRIFADKKDLLYADEIFGTNSVRGIIPIIRIDNHLIANGSVGPVTKKVYERYKSYSADRLQ